MTYNYTTSRNSNEKTIKSVLEAINIIDGISCESSIEGLFETKLTISFDKEPTGEDLIALGALIGTIEANQYI